jgi:hypothetical protein
MDKYREKIARIGVDAFSESTRKMRKAGIVALCLAIVITISGVVLFTEVKEQLDDSDKIVNELHGEGHFTTLSLQEHCRQLELVPHWNQRDIYLRECWLVASNAKEHWEDLRRSLVPIPGYGYFLTAISYVLTFMAPDRIGNLLCFVPGLVITSALVVAAAFMLQAVRTRHQATASTDF